MTRFRTPFDGHSTAAAVIAGVDLSGKSAVVTGGASGIGIETARALAGAGASVTIAVRNVEAGERVAADLNRVAGRAAVHVAPLDLADLASVRRFAEGWRGPLHILVNNAGVMALPETRTAHGWEMQFATNHLGHFALAIGLQNALAVAQGARIVSVSSSAHQRSPVIFDDINFAFRQYDPIDAYGQSKTANILFAVEAASRWAPFGITANSLMPGAISTNLQRHIGGMKTPPERRKTPAQGAATSVLLAASPMLDGVSGRYFVDCNEAELVDHRMDDMTGVAGYALDPDNASRLWNVSMRAVAHLYP